MLWDRDRFTSTIILRDFYHIYILYIVYIDIIVIKIKYRNNLNLELYL